MDPIARRVASRYLQASGWVNVSAHREAYQEALWAMYEASYRTIGMHLSGTTALLKYPHWEVHMGPDGQANAFRLAEPTPYGLKLTLGGSDGTPEGKAALKQSMAEGLKKPGWYGEVSHAVEVIAVKGGAPTVCAEYAGEVLKKPVVPDPDGVHYTRNLTGVGRVKKRMVGLPRGIPTTDSVSPMCPVSTQMPEARVASGEDNFEMVEHVGCMIDLE